MNTPSPSATRHRTDAAAGISRLSWRAVTSFSLPFRQLPVPDLSAPDGLPPVDLWCCNVDDLPCGLLDNPPSVAMLSVAEQHRLRAFRFDRDRLSYFAGRLLLRCTLSRYAGVEPANLQFRQNAFGRPELSPANAPPPKAQPSSQLTSQAGTLRFSLSRAGTMAVLAVSHSGAVGVDLEDTHRPIDAVEVAPGVLAEEELKVFRATPAAARQATFLRYWVLKEAYAKARGMGLSLEVRRVHFSPPGLGHIDVHLGAGVADSPTSWRFVFAPLSNQYPLAIAYRPDAT